MDRFMHQDIVCIGPVKRFDKMVIAFYDRYGHGLELVPHKSYIEDVRLMLGRSYRSVTQGHKYIGKRKHQK